MQSIAGQDSNIYWSVRLAEMPIPQSIRSNKLLYSAYSDLSSKGRISESTGLLLMDDAPLSGLTTLALMVKRSKHSDEVFFNENLHVNTTNICVLACRFCAFRKGPRHKDAYQLSVNEYLHRIEPFAEHIDEVHSVGGLHPTWTVEHYAELYRQCKQRFPHIHIKSLTAIEIKHIAERSNLSFSEVIKTLKESGLDSIPGGGAEILVDSVRDRICRGKESSQEYLDIHRAAHRLHIPTNCTMLFGTVESSADRIKHLSLLRELQDETGGFQCFVPYPFLRDKTRLPEAQLASSNEILRVISVSRLMLDNIPHIKAYRMNIGDSVSQMALSAGADDIDGTVGHEEIMHSAGSKTRLDSSRADICRLIEDAGYTPVKRNSTYSEFETVASLVTERTVLPIIEV